MRREKISGIVPKLFNPLIKGRRKLNVNKCKVLITFFNILYYLWHLSPCYIAPTSQQKGNLLLFFHKTPLQCWVRKIALENILRVLSHLLPLENDHFTPGWKQVIARVKVGVERAFNVIVKGKVAKLLSAEQFLPDGEVILSNYQRLAQSSHKISQENLPRCFFRGALVGA